MMGANASARHASASRHLTSAHAHVGHHKNGALQQHANRPHEAAEYRPAMNPFVSSCKAAFVFGSLLADFHGQCSPKFELMRSHQLIASSDQSATANALPLRWNCIAVSGNLPDVAANEHTAMSTQTESSDLLQGLCLQGATPEDKTSSRLRFLSVYLNYLGFPQSLEEGLGVAHYLMSRTHVNGHLRWPLPQFVAEPNWEGGMSTGKVATVSGTQKESVRHEHALAFLARDGVVRFGKGWGFRELLLQQPAGPHAGGTNIRSYITKRLDDLAKKSSVEAGRRHVTLKEAIPGIGPLINAIQSTIGKIAVEYLGNDTSFDRYMAFRLPPNLDLTHYPAGFYHHDRCGHRLKAYLLLTRVTEDSHPLRVALGSHKNLFYAHHNMRESRFTDKYIEKTYAIGSVTGEVGEGFLFDTNSVHKAGGAGLTGQGMRDVLVFEFNAREHSRKLCEMDPKIPCGC